MTMRRLAAPTSQGVGAQEPPPTLVLVQRITDGAGVTV